VCGKTHFLRQTVFDSKKIKALLGKGYTPDSIQREPDEGASAGRQSDLCVAARSYRRLLAVAGGTGKQTSVKSSYGPAG